jgi:hypothetical protein
MKPQVSGKNSPVIAGPRKNCRMVFASQAIRSWMTNKNANDQELSVGAQSVLGLLSGLVNLSFAITEAVMSPIFSRMNSGTLIEK